MSILRNEHEEKISNINTIISGCPICNSDVKGNDRHLFLCKKCNILFRREDLKLSKEEIHKKLVERITENFERDKDKLKINEEKIPTKNIKDSSKNTIRDITLLASKKSNIVHASNCPFAKNIKKENIIKFRTLEESKKYKKCKCVGEIYE